MKATDLMIGDWVCTEGDPTPRQIDWIRTGEVGLFWDKVATPPFLEPIPLTPEILEKNGWKTTDRYRYNRGNVWFDIINRGAEDFDIEVSAYDGGFAYVATIYNVHELQHALRLCGIEKEIKL